MAKRASKATQKPENRLKKPRNPNPQPPPVEYQFKPGQSGNPGGRPKLLSGAYRKMLAEVNPRDLEGRTNAELIAVAARTEALKGDVGAMREIRSATEGEKVVFDVSKLSDSELDSRIAELERTTRALADGEGAAASGAGNP